MSSSCRHGHAPSRATWCEQAWNFFDLLTAVMGCVSLAAMSLHATEFPAALRNIRILRAFRVVRLFKRFRHLNRVSSALVKAPQAWRALLLPEEPPSHIQLPK